ncbi:MAG TPA: SGNH/GDSL hydrolase family protein [Humisphaera sp.]
MISRRTVLTGALGAAAASTLRADEQPAKPTLLFPPGSRVLFQGDSITDGNRGRSADPNHILGHGYAFIIAAKHGAAHPDRKLEFLNRGVSGNTVADLAKRWEKDTLALAPTLLSILIGINDQNRGVTAETYEESYDKLLAETVKALPGVKLVLGEPFGLPSGKVKDRWDAHRAELAKRQAIVERLAKKHNAALVRFQRAFDEAAKRAPADYWIWDGVHPTYSGHQVMADEWERAVGEAGKA